MSYDRSDEMRAAVISSRRAGWAVRIRCAMAIDDYDVRQAVLWDIARELDPTIKAPGVEERGQ